MYIKSITINGFKSFAEKTVLDFVGPKRGKNSITAIVGPNGSGKSNVSDAIRWVLGEQSMKQLRGKKSEDIIFSGSEYKGQLGSASVTMALDNTDKRIPIEYDEIVITRRIYRSGESEYVLNGNEVRLFDLQLLLAKGQFGQGSYSIIGQGMIDRLILQSTEERKNFFDEAVGIKEFQLKRHQAILKLIRTKEHVAQAEWLLGEISPRLKTLKRQVQKLEERQGIEVELREVQETYFSTIWSYNNAHIEGLKKELDSLTLTQKEQQTLLDEVQEELAHLARESSRERFDELQKAYQDVMKQKGALEKERAMLLGKLQTEYSKAGKQNIGWIENKIGEVKNSLKEVELEKKRLQGELTEAKSHIKEKEIFLGNLLVEKTQLQNRVARLEQEILNATYQQSIQQFTGLRAVEEIRSKGKSFGLVYGTVSELASVDPKYQTALDVAAGNNLSSLVVDTELTGENCIRYLREKQLGYATFLPISKIRGRFVAQDLYE
ncbi:MAG: AAA family ATPase, partial [Candidatus Magasanikbacteria bacterium]